MKLVNLCSKYLNANKRLESSTADLVKRVFGHLLQIFGNIEIRKFGYPEAEKYRNWIVETDRQQTTANIWLKIVRPAFRWAIRQNIIDNDPFESLELFRIAKKRIRLYEPDEIEAMLNNSNDLWKLRILLAKTAGLRKGEILNLTNIDIDFRNESIYVQEKKETQFTWSWRPKDKDVREVPLVSEVAHLIMVMESARPTIRPYYPAISACRNFQVLRIKNTGLLAERIRKVPDENFHKPWQRILKRSGVLRGCFHDLRKTCITEWLEGGLMPHEVMKLAGHSDVETTMKYYTATRRSLVQRSRVVSANFLNHKNGTDNPKYQVIGA